MKRQRGNHIRILSKITIFKREEFTFAIGSLLSLVYHSFEVLQAAATATEELLN